MAKKLIYQDGFLTKTAAEGQPGEGPSFQQQFGILANAQIIDKYPALSSYQIAVQLLDKKDDNSFAVCVVIYKLGNSYIYVPAVFRNGKITTAQMMEVPSMQMMLPLSDAWMSWVKNKEVGNEGSDIPAEIAEQYGQSSSTVRSKQPNDPFMKSAGYKNRTIFDIALTMGKTASQKLLDYACNRDFLNSCFKFYSPQEIGEFAKTAALLYEQKDTTPYIISVMDKEASFIAQDLKETLYRDGYIVKSAELMDWGPAQNAIKVIKKKNITNAFSTPSKNCKCKLLTQDGELKEVTLLEANVLSQFEHLSPSMKNIGRFNFMESKWDAPAKDSIKQTSAKKLLAVSDGSLVEVDPNVAALTSSIEDIDNVSIGKALSEMVSIPCGSILITPNGKAYSLNIGSLTQRDGKGAFVSYNFILRETDDQNLKNPIFGTKTIEVPKGSKIVVEESIYNKDGSYKQNCNCDYKKEAFISITDLGKAIDRCRDKNFTQLKVVSDGNEIAFVGPKSNSDQRMQEKQAVLHMVNKYGICPQDAKFIVKEASLGTYTKPFVNTYNLYKEAAEDSNLWEPANIGMSEVPQTPPDVTEKDLQGQAEQDAKDMQTIQNAADSGIKQIFDTATLKMLVQNADPHDQILHALPDFMVTLDKLCRLLFLYRCHMQDMQERYGAVKMKALEQSLQNTIKDFSELTIFLKLRGLNNGESPDAGELQTGTMMQ